MPSGTPRTSRTRGCWWRVCARERSFGSSVDGQNGDDARGQSVLHRHDEEVVASPARVRKGKNANDPASTDSLARLRVVDVEVDLAFVRTATKRSRHLRARVRLHPDDRNATLVRRRE